MSLFQQGHALIIGIGNDLPVTEKDANDINSILIDPVRAAYPEQNVQVLTGENATKENIEKGLDKLIADTKDVKGTTAVVYYSGHGAQLPWLDGGQKYFLIPNDVNFEDVETFLPAELFTEKINQISTDKLLVILDCCHAEGQFVDEKSLDVQDKSLGRVKRNSNESLVKNLEGGQGKVFIASCKDNEKSYIGFGEDNSLFTKHLKTALNGAKSDQYDFIHVIDIISHLFRMVPNEAKFALDKEQTPIINFADKLDANFFICPNPRRKDTTRVKSFDTDNIQKKAQDEIDNITTQVINDYSKHIINSKNSGNENLTAGGDLNIGDNVDESIKAGGDINIGDTSQHIVNNNYYYNSAPPEKPTENETTENSDFLKKAQELTVLGDTDQALDLLNEKMAGSRHSNTLLMLTARLNSLKRQSIAGIVSNDQLQRSKNQINHSLLQIISDMQ